MEFPGGKLNSETLTRCSGGFVWKWVGCIPNGYPPPGSEWCPGSRCAKIQVSISGTVDASPPPWRFPSLWHDLCQLHVCEGKLGQVPTFQISSVFLQSMVQFSSSLANVDLLTVVTWDPVDHFCPLTQGMRSLRLTSICFRVQCGWKQVQTFKGVRIQRIDSKRLTIEKFHLSDPWLV